MKTTFIKATTALLLLTTTVASLSHKMIFDCDCNSLGEVCDNMCFGAFCQKWGATFTWDKPSESTGGKRSTKAGYWSTNRCSRSPYPKGDYQCDEYPFKSVKEADAGGQVNRCIKREYNNVLPRTQSHLTSELAQSQVIRQFYNSEGTFKGTGCRGTAPCALSIVFANAGNVSWCDTTAPSCKNDGKEFTKTGKVPEPSGKVTRRQDADSVIGEGGSYVLESGQVVVSAEALDPGVVAVWVKRLNETLFAECKEMHVPDPELGLEQYDSVMGNLYLEEDVVVGKV